jgi:hypothetical protein
MIQIPKANPFNSSAFLKNCIKYYGSKPGVYLQITITEGI